MNNYYLTLVLKADLEEKDRKALLDSTVKRLTEDEGKVEKEDLWGSKDLAYPIKRQNKGFYAHFEFESEPQTIFSLDKQLKVNEDVLRYLLVRV